MRRLVEYWPFLTACVLYFGFCNLYYYYKVFNIDIFAFISSSDILLSLFPRIVLLSTTLYSAIAQQLYLEIRKPSQEETSSLNTEALSASEKKKINRTLWIKKNIEIIAPIYYLIVILIELVFISGFNFKSYELAEFSLFADIIFLFIIYIAVSIADKNKLIYEKPLLIALFLVVFIGRMISRDRSSEALKIKDGITEQKHDHVSFIYNEEKIVSNDSLVLIGQTSNYLFLYNLKDSSTNAFLMNKLENLIIK